MHLPSSAGVSLGPGVELVGEYLSSGCTEAPYLVRRADGRMVEVSRLLYLVASHLDGTSDLGVVARRVADGLDRPIGVASVEYLIDNKLRPLGLIRTDGAATFPMPSRSPGLALSVRAGMVPPRLVRGCTTVLRPLFSRPVVAASLVGWIVADGWLVSGAGPDVRGVVSTPAVLLAVIGLTLAAGLFHELGHATASRYGGAEPGMIGAGIYLIWPVFYNDLNDSYRLDRRGRLRADLGGVYFNVVVILVMAGVYRLSGWGPLVAAIAVQHVAIAQQFLPFVRLDGYYVVSDLAGVPDLFARIRPVLAAALPGRSPGPRVAELTRRARAIVTVWVLVTVPVLLACIGLGAVALPSVLAASWLSVRAHGHFLVGALRAAAFGRAMLAGVELGALAVPFVGLGAVALGALGACSRWLRGYRRSAGRAAVGQPPPADPGTDAPTRTRSRLTLGGALVLLVCVTGTIQRPRATAGGPRSRRPSGGRPPRCPPGESGGALPGSPGTATSPGSPTC